MNAKLLLSMTFLYVGFVHAGDRITLINDADQDLEVRILRVGTLTKNDPIVIIPARVAGNNVLDGYDMGGRFSRLEMRVKHSGRDFSRPANNWSAGMKANSNRYEATIVGSNGNFALTSKNDWWH